MINVLNNKNNNPQDNIQAKINFKRDMKTLRMNLAGIDKNLKGYGYKYQNFNEIVREIKNVINKHNLDLDFGQFPTFTVIEGQKVLHVVRTTFFSTISDYEYSFDTPIYTENLQWNNENGPKNVNTLPQLVGSSITYFKRYALVAYLNIESEVDTDAAPIYSNYENENSTILSKQVGVNQEQKKDINQNQIKENSQVQKEVEKIDRYYYYGIFKEALSNMKNWINDSKIKDNIDAIIQKIGFIQKIDPNNIEYIKKIETDLIKYFDKNKEFKNINYWEKIIKDYFKRNNKLQELKDFEKFMSFKKAIYGASPLIFFSVLKKEKQFDYIFAA
ncbi:ERF family protein [Borreliella burgdorferi]|uniref:ERF family protein n=1 Tax=Borreliella burgdorferi TaxID=139 RepID=UPI000D02392F|nr:ERF family protein [Borreliella burgdorferi]PRR32203.1 single-stranded DNA-binding protein [Borreliella burgdorferi]